MKTMDFISFARAARLGYHQFEKDAGYTFDAINYIGHKTCTKKGFNDILNRILKVLTENHIKGNDGLYELGEFVIYLNLIEGKIELYCDDEDIEILGDIYEEYINYIPVIDITYELKDAWFFAPFGNKNQYCEYGILENGDLYFTYNPKTTGWDGGYNLHDTKENREKIRADFKQVTNENEYKNSFWYNEKRRG